ncbi:hypothetical protein QL285_031717 [Trifolium repens]|nr:hypothetical protein QL285_031717 [Trifolium repens]
MNKCLHHVLGEAYFHKCLHASTQSILHHLLLSISLSSLSSSHTTKKPLPLSLYVAASPSHFARLSPPYTSKTTKNRKNRKKKKLLVSATTTEPPPREFEAAAKRHCLRPPFHLLLLTQSDDSGEPPLTSYSQTIQIQGW